MYIESKPDFQNVLYLQLKIILLSILKNNKIIKERSRLTNNAILKISIR